MILFMLYFALQVNNGSLVEHYMQMMHDLFIISNTQTIICSALYVTDR